MRAWRSARPMGAVRPLRRDELDAALTCCAADPVASVMVAARLEQMRAGERCPGEIWALHEDGEVVSVCWSGANLVPIPDPTGHAVRAFAEFALRQGKQCSAICGPRDEVLQMWHILREDWAPAREVRANQPSLTLTDPPQRQGDRQLRPASFEEFDAVFDASVRMFTEEVGYSPLVAGGAYRQRVAEQIRRRLIFVRPWTAELAGPGVPPELVFKGEIGARGLGVVQLQGLWVEPSVRRRGIGSACVARMARVLLSEGARQVSLYVNDYNTAARAMYRKLGFVQAGSFATVLL